MKVIKLANENDPQNGRPMVTHTFEIIRSIGKSNIFEKCLGISSVANGTVGWYQYDDGTTYEVSVSPVEYSQYKSLLEEQQNFEMEDGTIEEQPNFEMENETINENDLV